jgi:UDP-glucose 4-epimerase
MNREGILLLGGGFMGGALARRLSDMEKRVHIITLSSLRHTASKVFIHKGSLDEREILERVLPECGTIIHLASSTTPGNSSRHPALEAKLNITPMLNFLEILEDYKKFHLIFVSSGGTIYGNPKRMPVDEGQAISPISYYGAGKIALEYFLRVFEGAPQKNITIVRPPNVYGPGQSFRQGFGIIRTMLEHLRHGTKMEIWGDGETVRDFLYIEDMIRALILLIDMTDDNSTYNIGTGVGHSLNQIIQIVEEVCNRQLCIEYREKRKSDVNAVIIDSSRFMKKTGWQPEMTLEDGILKTWQWITGQ